jgi:short-subunit dehydrogenase
MNIIVTGASQGVGYELVKYFCDAIDDVSIIAVARSQSKLEALKEECTNRYNVSIEILAFDLSREDIAHAIINELPSGFQKLDILINNSAALINKPFPAVTYEEAIYLYKINTLAPYFLTQALIGHLRESPLAHVVNISSMGGFQGSSKFPGLSLYSSTKAALSNLTECLAEELNQTSIKVNALALGSVNTSMLRDAFPDYISPNTPEDMAKFIGDFALNCGVIFNGKVLPVSNSTP